MTNLTKHLGKAGEYYLKHLSPLRFCLYFFFPLSALIFYLRQSPKVTTLLKYNLIYSPAQVELWLMCFIMITLYSIFILGFIYLKFKENRNLPKWILYTDIFTYTTLITVFLIICGLPKSNLALLYMFPLLIIVNNTTGTVTRWLIGSVILIFVGAILSLHKVQPIEIKMSLSQLVDYIFARGLFFILISYLIYLRNFRLQKQTIELETLERIALNITESNSLEKRLEDIIEAASLLLKASGSKIYLKVPNQNNYRRLVAIQGLENDNTNKEFKKGALRPLNDGIVGQIFSDGITRIENDYPNSPYAVEDTKDLFRDKKARVEAPCKLDNEVIAVIGVFDESRKFMDDDIPLMERFAQHAAIAIRDMQLFEGVTKQAASQRILQQVGMELSMDFSAKSGQLPKISKYAWELTKVYNEVDPVMVHFCAPDNEGNSLEVFDVYPKKPLSQLKQCIDNYPKQDFRNIISKISEGKLYGYIDKSQENADSNYIWFDERANSQFIVPIRNKQGIFGAIVVEFSKVYNELNLGLQDSLKILAAQVGLSLDNNKLLRQIQNISKLLDTLLDAEEEIVEKANDKDLNLESVGKEMLHSITSFMSFQKATLYRVNNEDNYQLNYIASHPSHTNTLNKLPKSTWVNFYRLPEQNLDQFPQNGNEVFQLILTEGEEQPCLIPWTNSSPDDFNIGIPLTYCRTSLGLIMIEPPFGCDEPDQLYSTFLRVFQGYTSSLWKNALLFKEFEKVNFNLKQKKQELETINLQLEITNDDLEEKKTYLETLFEYFDRYKDLAVVAMVHGEDLHFAKNKLGIAKVYLSDIKILADMMEKYPDKNLNLIKGKVNQAQENIQLYFDTLNKLQQKHGPTLDFQEVYINEMLDETLAMKSKNKSQKIKVIRQYQNCTDIKVNVPAFQLRQVFLVIIHNAFNSMSMSTHGTLIIRTNLEDPIRGKLQRVIVKIEDTGGGIPKHIQKNLFELKVKTDSHKRQRGVGIGLPWAKFFMMSIGGDIHYSTSKKGTTMYIFVPLEGKGIINYK